MVVCRSDYPTSGLASQHTVIYYYAKFIMLKQLQCTWLASQLLWAQQQIATQLSAISHLEYISSPVSLPGFVKLLVRGRAIKGSKNQQDTSGNKLFRVCGTTTAICNAFNNPSKTCTPGFYHLVFTDRQQKAKHLKGTDQWVKLNDDLESSLNRLLRRSRLVLAQVPPWLQVAHGSWDFPGRKALQCGECSQ